jgi:hypothetical protein
LRFETGRRYRVGMDRLTTEQARTIHDALGPARCYLVRLVERTDRTNLRNRDPKLYRLARAAEDALHSQTVELHYKSCGHGVGRPPAVLCGPDAPLGSRVDAVSRPGLVSSGRRYGFCRLNTMRTSGSASAVAKRVGRSAGGPPSR